MTGVQTCALPICPATRWSVGADFSDAAGFAAAPGLYRSLGFADVDGDGYADACIRTTGGIVCALNTKLGTFAPASAWFTTGFTDATGWSVESSGATIHLADVNGDGKADVCGRSSVGIQCALSTGTAFTRLHLWSFRSDFSDAGGWAARRSAWGSIVFADVNGDGLADVCGRSPSGVVCAISTGATFDGARLVAPVFSDLAGWQPDLYGPSLAVGDIDRDGRADFCARGPSGAVCTLSP